MGQRCELMLVEAFVAKSPVKTLDESVLRWLPGLNEMQANLAIASPACHRDRCQLCAIVHDDGLRIAANFANRIENAGNASPRERGVDFNRQAFAGEIVDDIERSDAAPRFEAIVDKVKGPAFVHVRHQWSRTTAPKCYAALEALANLQICLAVNPQNPLDVHVPAVTPKQYGEPAKTKTPPLKCKLFEPSAQRAIILGNSDVANHASVRLNVPTCLTFADVELFASRLHDSTLLRRRQKFPEAAIFSVSICSA
jgi:hypothetical protein